MLTVPCPYCNAAVGDWCGIYASAGYHWPTEVLHLARWWAVPIELRETLRDNGGATTGEATP
jgi:hypothetical protein